MIVSVVLSVVAILIAVFLVVFRRMAARPPVSMSPSEWLDGFSIEAYVPMQRLLDQRDVVFLASQPGYRPEITKRLMSERRAIFRGYLRLLTRDFNQLIAIGKLMVVYSTTDRPDLAKALWKQQVTFYLAVCAIQWRLAVHPLGWSTVDVRGLVGALESMRDQVSQLAGAYNAASQMA